MKRMNEALERQNQMDEKSEKWKRLWADMEEATNWEIVSGGKIKVSEWGHSIEITREGERKFWHHDAESYVNLPYPGFVWNKASRIGVANSMRRMA